MSRALHVLLLSSLLGLLHSQYLQVDDEEYLDDVDELMDVNLDEYYHDDIGRALIKLINVKESKYRIYHCNLCNS